MTREYGPNLLSIDRSAFAAAWRPIENAAMTLTSPLGNLNRYMRRVRDLTRPIETDLGMARLMCEQLAATREIAGLRSWTENPQLGIDRSLQVPRTDQLLAALTSPATVKLQEVAGELAMLREQTAGLRLDVAHQLARGVAREIESTVEALSKQLSYPLNQAQNHIREYLADTVGAVDFQALAADAVDVRPFLRTARSAAAHLARLYAEAEVPDPCVSTQAEADLGTIRAALAEVGLEAGGTIDLITLQRAMKAAVRQATKKPARAVVLHWLLDSVRQILVAVLVAWAFAQEVPPNQKPRAVQRQVSIAARQLSTDSATLAHLRIVLKPNLPVFKQRSRKSGRVDTLPLGDVVIVIQRQRNWTRVEWTEDGTALRGWVFSRHLGRIQPHKAQPKKQALPPGWACD